MSIEKSGSYSAAIFLTTINNEKIKLELKYLILNEIKSNRTKIEYCFLNSAPFPKRSLDAPQPPAEKTQGVLSNPKKDGFVQSEVAQENQQRFK